MNIRTKLIKKPLTKTLIEPLFFKPIYTTNAATQTSPLHALHQPHFSSCYHSQNLSLLNTIHRLSQLKPTSIFAHSSSFLTFWGLNGRSFSKSVSVDDSDETDEDIVPIDEWEEEDEAEPEIGDGGDGGGIVLQNCFWGARALSIAQEILAQFGDDIELFSFKTTPRGYIYVRLDKLPNKYGCPDVEVIESYNRAFKKRLDEVGQEGELPEDLAIEVSSPGAERLLKVPNDLQRFQDMPMRVSYIEDVDTKCPEKTSIFYLDSLETESGSCVWRLADVKENRDPAAKGRPFSRKQKDWRLKLSYAMVKKVTLYLDC
ncbi:hypothetical protein DCAR_0832946 [Daucus carota subsp. sativus]|uniref:DUF7912 domain-containing protein n=1 Tax=Daucus carota subsp. sativus TaxID=79200 RepID=A0AAF0XSD8_DAUCS|nr:PREDICTED: uncharacterized protein LOC108198667 isoform X1 [Daucus carota subsp. sativus]WOH13436.1 hypothetical protein DCAR_0832946 [Daucus carota subsp. sativus]